METTLDIPASLYHQAKQVAAAQGVSVNEFITRAIEHKLRLERRPAAEERRARFPLVPSDHPGILDLTAERIAELLSEDDRSP